MNPHAPRFGVAGPNDVSRTKRSSDGPHEVRAALKNAVNRFASRSEGMNTVDLESDPRATDPLDTQSTKRDNEIGQLCDCVPDDDQLQPDGS